MLAPYYVSGILHLYLGNAEPAETLLRRAADADPDDAFSAYFLGQILLQSASHAQAASWFLRAVELDPYLRSAYWAGAQALRRAGRIEESQALLADYQRFDDNPAAHSAAFSYGRMGPKALALAAAGAPRPAPERPAGALFAAPERIGAGAWSSVTAADIDGDGALDLAVSGPDGNSLFFGTKDAGFTAVTDHPLTAAGAGANLWGDMDNDGDVDMLLCGPGGARLWWQLDDGAWKPAKTGHDAPCDAGALFDADHDGDLDIFVTGPAGSELLNNNRDGSFHPLADEMGLAGGAGRQVLAADLDRDRDLDILVLNTDTAPRCLAERPHVALPALSRPGRFAPHAACGGHYRRCRRGRKTGNLRRFHGRHVACLATERRFLVSDLACSRRNAHRRR